MTSLTSSRMESKPDGEPELVVYETVDVDSSSEEDFVEERANEDIIASVVTRDRALEAFEGPARRADDSVSTRVARIRREIEELRREGAQTEAADLLTDLKSALTTRNPKNSPPDQQKQVQLDDDKPANSSIESRPEFADLEARVALLESRFGMSLRSSRSPESLASSVAQLRQTVELLAANPDSISALLDKIKGAEPSKARNGESRQTRIDTLYYRLRALDEAIEVLPHVVSRLQTLRYVHTEAVNQHEQFKDMQKTMDSMQGELKSWRSALESVENRVAQYIEVSERNIEKLRH